MIKNSTHLKLNIKGSIRNFIARWNTHRKLKSLGVDVKNIQDLDANQVEILVSGERIDLWRVVNWSKKNDVFMFLNEVVFEFVEA